MSALAIVLIVIAILLVGLFVGGLVVSRRRRGRPGFELDVARADQALEAARAADRGWDRTLLDEAAREALAAERPDFQVGALELVLVEDRPGVEDDRAHLRAVGAAGAIRVVLARDSAGRWIAERVE